MTSVLGFSGSAAALVISCGCVVTVFAPLAAATIANRSVGPQRLYALCAFAAAITLCKLACDRDYDSFWSTYIVYALFVGIANALVQAICFQQMGPSRRHLYGVVRTGSTLGWMAAAWGVYLVRLLYHGTGPAIPLHRVFYLSACAFSAGAVYVLTLRRIDVASSHSSGNRLPSARAIVATFENSALRSALFMVLLAAICDQIFFFGAAPRMRGLGISQVWVLPLLAIGQVTELFAMPLIGRIIKRYGFRVTIIAGATAHTARFALLSASSSLMGSLCGVALHGFGFTLCFTALAMLVDTHSDSEHRAGAHLLFGATSGGLGGIIGFNVAGRLFDAGFRSTTYL